MGENLSGIRIPVVSNSLLVQHQRNVPLSEDDHGVHAIDTEISIEVGYHVPRAELRSRKSPQCIKKCYFRRKKFRTMQANQNVDEKI
jgi:hypothetical protein